MLIRRSRRRWLACSEQQDVVEEVMMFGYTAGDTTLVTMLRVQMIPHRRDVEELFIVGGWPEPAQDGLGEPV